MGGRDRGGVTHTITRMSGAIFLRDGQARLVAMHEQAYDSEGRCSWRHLSAGRSAAEPSPWDE
jgi:hypothetical protein